MSLLVVVCRARRALAFAITILAAASAPAAAPFVADPDEAARKLVKALIKKCAEREDEHQARRLDGVLIDADRSKVRNGKLHLVGYCDHGLVIDVNGKEVRGQQGAVKEEADRLLKDNPKWAWALPRGVTYDGLEDLPLRSRYVGDLQGEFAKSEGAVRRTRLDGAYFQPAGEGFKLVFHGVGADSRAKEPTKLVLDRIESAVGKLPALEKLRPVLKAYPPSVRLADVVWTEQPYVIVQNKLALLEPDLDGALLFDNWYDAGGVLQIEGFVREEAHRKTVEKYVRDIPPGSAPLDRPGRKREGSFSVERVGVKADLLPKKEALQEVLAESVDDLKRTRIDRVALHYPRNRGGIVELLFGGVYLPRLDRPSEDDQGEEKVSRKPLPQRAAKFLAEQVLTLAPTLETRYGVPEGGNADAIKPVQARPQDFVKAENFQKGPLEGVGLSLDAHYYGKKGQLVVKGVCRDRKQETELRKALAEIPVRRRLIRREGDFSFDLDPLPTDVLLRKMRDWAADEPKLEDARIDTLSFEPTEKGAEWKLKLRVRCREEDRKKIQEHFEALLADHPKFRGRTIVDRLISRRASAPSWDRSDLHLVAHRMAAPPAKFPAELVEARFWEGWAQRLRNELQVRAPKKDEKCTEDKPWPDSKWSGVRITRGYFRPEDNRYALRGLVDSEKQRKELEWLIQDHARDRRNEDWQEVAKGLDLGGLEVVPLEPMLKRMRLIFPAYEVFDGLTLVGARHDVNGKLHLRVRVVGKGIPEGAAAKILEQLDEHDVWKKRSDRGVCFVEVSYKRSSYDSAVLLLRAIAAMKIALAEPQSFSRLSDCPPTSNRAPALEAAVSVTDQRKLLGAARLLLDAFLLNEPGDSAGWFLRGLIYQLEGDSVQARRDVRRMVELERQRPGRRLDRLASLEPFQGALRRRINLMEKNMVRDVIADRSRLTLSE